MTQADEGFVEKMFRKTVDKMILAFNRDGLLRIEDIFSLLPADQISTIFKTFQIEVNSYSLGSLPYDLYETLYQNVWEYYFIRLSILGSGIFTHYFNKISSIDGVLEALNLPPYVIITHPW